MSELAISPAVNEELVLKQKSVSLVEQVAMLPEKIETIEHYTSTVELARAGRSMKKNILQWWDENKAGPAYKLWKQLVADRDQMAGAVQDRVISPLDARITAYEREQEAIRQEAERQAQEAARKAQDEAAIAEAAHLEAAGDALGAEAVIAQAVNAPPPPVVMPSFIPKVAGKSTKTIWKWRVKNPAEIKREYLMPDESKIGQIVRALKGSAATAVGGIEVYEEKSVSIRT